MSADTQDDSSLVVTAIRPSESNLPLGTHLREAWRRRLAEGRDAVISDEGQLNQRQAARVTSAFGSRRASNNNDVETAHKGRTKHGARP